MLPLPWSSLLTRRYMFSDESGDLSFTRKPNISNYFAVGTLVISEADLSGLRITLGAVRDDLAFRKHGLDSYFHATNDPPEVRLAVFDALAKMNFQVDVTLLDKTKAPPEVRPDEATFFRNAWLNHLKRLAPQEFEPGDEALIVAAELGTKRSRKAFRGAIEEVMTECISFRVKRTLAFWPCSSDFALQAADYCLWAATRKWERGDPTYYRLVASKIRSEIDVWAASDVHYY